MRSVLVALVIAVLGSWGVMAQQPQQQTAARPASEETLPGVDVAAQTMAGQVIDLIEGDIGKFGAARVINEIGRSTGAYASGDTYAFVVDRRSNTFVAHPLYGQAIGGKRTWQQVYDSDRRPFGQLLMRQLQSQGWGYVRVRLPSAKTQGLLLKSVLCRPDRGGAYVLCVSIDEAGVRR